MVNVDDPDDAADELTRCRALGLVRRAHHRRAAVVAAVPVSPTTTGSGPTAQDLDMPLSLHAATDRGDPQGRRRRVPPRREARAAVGVRQPGPPGPPVARRPRLLRRLRAVSRACGSASVEHELGWIPFFLDQLDYTYTDRPPRGDWHRFPIPTAPERLLPPQLLRLVPGGRRSASASATCIGVDTPHVGQRLPAHRVDVPALAGDPLRHPRRASRPTTRARSWPTNAAEPVPLRPPPLRARRTPDDRPRDPGRHGRRRHRRAGVPRRRRHRGRPDRRDRRRA